MRTILSLLILSFTINVSAGGFYEQLCDFNYNWKKYKDRAPAGEAKQYTTDNQLVADHLEQVISILRSSPTTDLTTAQIEMRTDLIATLDEYRLAGTFPQNYYRQERVPVFIDEHDTHCAVGFLMRASGSGQLARQIAAANNYAWVKEIEVSGLSAWQQRSGFSLEELKLIQGAYDYYMPNALLLPNKTEVPQKPIATLRYFDKLPKKLSEEEKEKYVWLRGEGNNGVLNGKWEQNYAVGKPWIVGWYENGKRTGQWREYYQGTDKLCRTEVWRNDKLNGVRRRYDRKGDLIEEITFKDGKAILKINYDLRSEIKYIRRPLDSGIVDTEVYTMAGELLAAGKARIHNPGNLEWFQDIELTALNSASITSRKAVEGYNIGFRPEARSGRQQFSQFHRPVALYNQPSLVQYQKLDDWIYYKNYNYERNKTILPLSVKHKLQRDFGHYADEIYASIQLYGDLDIHTGYDSIRVTYQDNVAKHFYGYESDATTHLKITYHDPQLILTGINQIWLNAYNNQMELKTSQRVKEIGRCDEAENRVGEWKHFDAQGRLYKVETYLIPWKEEEDAQQSTSMIQTTSARK